MKSLLDWALYYATEKHWPVFPCLARKKVPLTKNGVLDATTNERQITDWWTLGPDNNIGLDVGGAGMMVLDFDPGSDIKELEKNVGSIPVTALRSHTPRGGEHRFFTLSPDELVSPSSSKLSIHVDVRSFHSYVLLPPSATEDGAYTWESDGKAAHRTDEMVRAANSAREKHKDRDEWIVRADLPENINLAATWLRGDAKVAIEGQGGDHTAYATGAYLKSLAISEELALTLMLEHWNPRCTPPWGEDEQEHLRQKIANAYRYNTSPPGNLTPGFHQATMGRHFKAVTHSVDGEAVHGVDESTRAGGFRFVDRAGLDHIPEPTWIVRDLIPDEGYVILFGPRSSLKTFVALDVALSVAAGFPLDPTWEVEQAGPVLFAAGEGRASLARRVKAWEALHHAGKPVCDFVLVDPVPTTVVTEENMAALTAEALRRHPGGYRLVVVDTLGKAMTGADENSQKDASMMTALVGRLRGDLGGSVLCVAHSGVQTQTRPMGSTVFEADADTLVQAVRRAKELMVELRMVKQRDAPEWEAPKRVKMVKVLIGEKTTLAAAPAPAPTAEEVAEAQAQRTSATDVVLGVIDREIKTILEANPMKTWTQVDLAEALAMCPAIAIDSKTLAGANYMIRVRERKDTFANTAYDPARNRTAGRWRMPS